MTTSYAAVVDGFSHGVAGMERNMGSRWKKGGGMRSTLYGIGDRHS